MKRTVLYASLAVVPLTCISCNLVSNIEVLNPERVQQEQATESDTLILSLEDVARMLSRLPLGEEQLGEVHDAALSSDENGYDEEYTMANIFNNPGGGLGSDPSKAAKEYSSPLRDLITAYYEEMIPTKAGAVDVQKYLDALTESEIQIYWPNSDLWNGSEYPTITFDPSGDTETNMAYRITRDAVGLRVVDSLIIDESYALEHPVWIVSKNEDGNYVPLLMSDSTAFCATKSVDRTLMLQSFTMLRNYDSWFGGASEFFIKIGAVDGFSASTEAELKLYYPTVTDFMISIKRRDKGTPQYFNSILLSNFTNQMDNVAFLITEDDGGTRTSWKCELSVKIKSKTYGIDIDIPFNTKDDIVWRGQLSADYFRAEDYVQGRFGDVQVGFALQ